MKFRISVALILFLQVLVAKVSSAAFVEEWTLSVLVDGFTDYDVDFNITPTNGYMGSLLAALDNSLASSSYDMAWSELENTGSFRTDSNLLSQGPNPGSPTFFSSATTNVRIQSNQDLVLVYDSSHTFALGSGDREVVSTLDIADLTNLEPVFSGGAGSAPIGGGPSSGVLDFQHTMVLPAGPLYSITTRFRLIAFSGSPSSLSSGSGFSHFTLAPVPEPATSLLLTFAAASVVVRRRRRNVGNEE